MDSLIVFIAKDFILIPILATLYLLLKLSPKKRRDFIILLIATGVLSYILSQIAAQLYDDPRPYIKDGVAALFNHSSDPNGFPSDHTLLASLLGFVALNYSKKLGTILLLVALLIGWARVAAHVHHAVDIIGSFVITAVSYYCITYILGKKATRKHTS